MRSIRYRPTVQVDRSVRQDHVPGNLALKPRIVANIDLRDLLINKGQRAITLISSFRLWACAFRKTSRLSMNIGQPLEQFLRKEMDQQVLKHLHCFLSTWRSSYNCPS